MGCNLLFLLNVNDGYSACLEATQISCSSYLPLRVVVIIILISFSLGIFRNLVVHSPYVTIIFSWRILNHIKFFLYSVVYNIVSHLYLHDKTDTIPVLYFMFYFMSQELSLRT